MAVSRASESNNSMLYVLVVFIVLFLAAAVFAVVMFLSNENLRKDAENAQADLRQFGNSSELREVQPLIQKGARSVTVLKQLTADMKYLCGLIGGEDLTNLPLVGAKAAVDKRLKPLWEEKLPYALSNPEEGDPSAGLANIVESLINERDNWAQMYVQAERDKDNQARQIQQMKADMDSQIAQMELDLGKASSSATTHETVYQHRLDDQSQRYEDLINRIKEEKQQVQAENDQLTKDIEAMQTSIGKYEAKLKELEGILQQVRPSPEMEMAALETDGSVVEVNLRDETAYISLAKNDHIYRGLTFTVYDSFQAIPKTGKGKATLEVTEIMDTISKCRITQYDPTNPIMQKDIIANLIWDKDKKYQFCVTGDFDFDHNGQIDVDGQERIIGLITAWGGLATESLSVDTDFLVLGRPPVLPSRPMEEGLGGKTKEELAYDTAKERIQKYIEIRQNGASLGVPTFNISRFFRFIGYHPKAIRD